MNEIKKIEKKLYIITAVLFTVLGGVVGLYVAEFLSGYFPIATRSQKIISCAFISLLFALVMLSLSKPIGKALRLAMEKMQTNISGGPSYKIMNVIFGLVLGSSISILTSSILSVFTPSLKGSIHFIIVTAVFCIVTYLSAYVFDKILGTPSVQAYYQRGYVIASSAFESDRLIRLAPKLVGKIAVMDITASLLAGNLADAELKGEGSDKEKKAFDNYAKLKETADIKFACGDPTISENENIMNLARVQKLKIIALDKLELYDDDKLDVLYLNEI